MRLSDEQRRALDLDRNVALVAGAGSGKTRVLVARLLEALAAGAKVSSILCVTFTEKAARELAERVRAELERRVETSAAAGEPDEAARWARLLEEVAGARLGTLHAYCAHLLRANADAAGIDPDFGVLQGLDRTLLVREALTRVLSEQPITAPPTEQLSDLAEAVALLCTETGRVRMQQWIKELLGHRERLEPFLDALVSRGEDTLLERERELLPELERLCWARVPRSRAIARHAELLETARRLMRELAPDSELLPLVEGLLALRDCRPDEADTAREIGLGVGRLLCNPKGAKSGFKRPLKTAGLDAVPVLADLNDALVAIARDVWRSVRAAREGFHDEHERLAIRRARAIAHLVRSVFARYDALKAREGVLDFDDLERHARALLADDGPVIERYAHVLMDEFQDTNRLQWELVKRVAPADPGGPELARAGIFVVGDPVQSIYGFRDAEVGVFADAAVELRLRDGPDRLRESYRSLPAVVSFVNAWFEKLLAEPRRLVADEPDFTPLIAQRPSIQAVSGEVAGRVEVLAATATGDADEPDTAEQTRALESDLVARRILALVEPERVGLSPDHPLAGRVVDEADGAVRPARWGDVAILLRGRTALAAFEDALWSRGIPYVVLGGIALYQSQEVRDLLCLMRALLDPRDDYAHLGLFRGPFVGLSDEALVLAADLPGRTLRARVLALRAAVVEADADAPRPPLHPADEATLRGLPDLELWRRRLELGPLGDAIRGFCDESGAWGAFAAGPWGVRAVGNVEKVLALAREEDRKGLWDARRFCARLGLLVDEGVAEAEAPPIDPMESDGGAANAVRIMTIHAAKGLEFPIVIVPELHQPFADDREDFAVHRELGLGAKAPHPEHGYATKSSVRRRLIQERARAAQAAEEKRVLYVAATRARDQLVLSLVPSDPRAVRTDGSFESWLARDLGVTRAAALGRGPIEELERTGGVLVRAADVPEPAMPRVESVEDDRASAEQIADRVPSGAFTDAGPPAGDDLPAELAPVLDAVAPIEPPPSPVRLTPTRLKTLADCPRRYAYRYVIGLEEYADRDGPLAAAGAAAEGHADGDADGALAASPFAFGTLAHRALELALLRGIPLPMGPLFARSLRRSLALEHPGVTEEELDRAQRIVDALPTSPVGNALLAATDRRLEVPVRLAVGSVLLEGSIDALHRTQQGGVRVVDYKTDAEKKGILERYRLPMLVYGIAVRRALQAETVELCLYTTARPKASPFYPPLDEAGERRALEEIAAVVETLPPAAADLERYALKKPDRRQTRQDACGACGYFQARICPAALEEGARAISV